jgi:phage-related holin
LLGGSRIAENMSREVIDGIATGMKWLTAAVVGVWQGVPQLTQLLIALMIADALLSWYVAGKDHRLTLRDMESGAYIKVGNLLVLAIMAILTPYTIHYLEFNLVQSVTVILLPREGASIMASLAAMGIQIPQAQQILETLTRPTTTTTTTTKNNNNNNEQQRQPT